MCRYVTGKSIDTGQAFHEAHPEVAGVRTVFHEWLRTAYGRLFHFLRCHFADPAVIGEEEKKQRSLQGAVSLLSMASTSLADASSPITTTVGAEDDAPQLYPKHMDHLTTPVVMDTEDDVSRPNDDVSPPDDDVSPPDDDVSPPDDDVSPPDDTVRPTTPAVMDTEDNVSPPDDTVRPTTPVVMDTEDNVSPPDLTNTEGLTIAAVGSRDETSPTNLRDTPGTSLQAPPPSVDDTDSDPPSPLSVLPHSAAPAPKTPPTHPALATPGNNTFDLTGVRGDFISERTCEYWGSVSGGEKWLKMVKSYLTLEKIPAVNRVSANLC
jgi:hypothetical protein